MVAIRGTVVASATPNSSSIGAFFGNLFGSKRDNTSANVRESSVTQQPKSQAAPIAPSAASGQTQAIATTKGTPEAQRTTDSKKLATTNSQGAAPQQEPGAEQPQDAGVAPTTNLLIGAVPTVRTGRFENRPVALGQSQQKQLS